PGAGRGRAPRTAGDPARSPAARRPPRAGAAEGAGGAAPRRPGGSAAPALEAPPRPGRSAPARDRRAFAEDEPSASGVRLEARKAAPGQPRLAAAAVAEAVVRTPPADLPGRIHARPTVADGAGSPR